MPTRRLVLSAALMAGAVAGCTTDPVEDPTPATDPDVALAATALAAERVVLELIDSVVTAQPRRAVALTATRSVHVAHVELLDDAVGSVTPAPSRTPAVPFTGDDRAAYLALARAEDRLGQSLRRAAFSAASGPFARVLAGMAAATAQQSAWLRMQA